MPPLSETLPTHIDTQIDRIDPAFCIPRNPSPLPRPNALRNQCRAAVGLFCVCVAVFVAGAPSLLRFLYPAAALLLAVFLFARSRTSYIQFVFWLYLLSPFVRRLVDQRAGFVAVSPLLLAPVFATCVSGYVLLTRARSLGRAGALPFTCALAGIFFGTVIGLTHYGPATVGRAFLNWIPPVLFGFFLYEERDRYPEYQRAVTQALLYGTLVIGVYALVQFAVLPSWDRQWMIDVESGVFGPPEPLKLRVFSTMNAPATFATYMMACALLFFCIRNRLRIVLVPLAFLALLLTTSRASWVGFAGGVAYLGFRLNRRGRVELLGAMLVCVMLTAGLAVAPIPEVQTLMSSRLKSLTDSHDVSLTARIAGHIQALQLLVTEPFGEGLGSTDTDHSTDMNDDSLGPHDSTMLECLYSLGGPGTLVYVLGLLFGAMRVMRYSTSDEFAVGMAAVFAAYVTECMLNSILLGVLGFMVWTAVGMTLAAAERTREGFA